VQAIPVELDFVEDRSQRCGFSYATKGWFRFVSPWKIYILIMTVVWKTMSRHWTLFSRCPFPRAAEELDLEEDETGEKMQSLRRKGKNETAQSAIQWNPLY
jgi:hypothetical protein